MHTTLHLKTSLKAVALLAGVVLAMLLVMDGQQVQQAQAAPLPLSQASMLLPALG
ncbi:MULTISPECIES: hypothetical protein [unclassified Janthinobacterium]|uniref:hypothetical protein n=1 Tax=unclassified Janthinobacterium TaxID=2610881 RepID=UPI0012EC7B82|nr:MULTISPECIES: hypothetical protein [unclassified Janthinobacterium]MDN2710381.1 hypothetical protein [Janthinobacterium sp. SUN118]